MLIEARLVWGEDLVAVAHISPRDRVCLADFGLPLPCDDGLVVAVPSVTIVGDCLALHVRLVAKSEKLPWSFGDLRVSKGVSLAAILHAALLVIAFIARASPQETEAESFEVMKAMIATLEAREHPIADAEPGADDAPLNEDPGTPTKPKAPGAAGTAASTSRHGVTQHAPPREEAATFGMIGILAAGLPGSSVGGDAFARYEGPSAVGSIFGTTIEDAMGVGGATLSGSGEGGGGPGKGIGINGVSGRCGDHCDGLLGTAGRFGGKGIGLGHGHAVKSPVLRCGIQIDEHTGCDSQVNGRLPPETVQRIVRQSFGRLRACYESGLRRNPSLEGRIAVKFVIDRDGAVSMASVADSDLHDSEVAACVARGFQAMSFPPPAGGIVTVVYPLVFSS